MSDEPKLWSDTPWQETAEGLGYVVLSWTALEATATEILRHLLHLTSATAESVLGHLEIKAKLDILKTFAYAKRVDDEWFEHLEQTLVEIDTVLRVERNRMVHDYWRQSGLEMIRLNPKPKLKQPQARQPRVVVRDQPAVSRAAIDQFTRKILAATGELAVSLQELAVFEAHFVSADKWQ